MRTGQVWSMDLVVAVIVFLLAIGVFYFFTHGTVTDESSTLQVESQIIANKLAGDEAGSIANGTAINEVSLKNLVYADYGGLKGTFGVHDDFCIILRDQDGNIVVLGNQSGTGGYKVGVGNGDLNLTFKDGAATVTCGQLLTEGQVLALQ